MSEQERIHNSGWSIRLRSKFYDKIAIFWKLVLHCATVILFLIFFLLVNILSSLFMEGFSRYIVSSKPFPSSTCLSSNLALQYLSY